VPLGFELGTYRSRNRHDNHSATRPRTRRIPPPPAENGPRRRRQIICGALPSRPQLKSAALIYVARRIFLLSFHIHHGSPTLGTAQYTAELGYWTMHSTLYCRYISNCNSYSLAAVRFSTKPNHAFVSHRSIHSSVRHYKADDKY